MVFEDRKGNTTNEYQTLKGTQRKKFVSPPLFLFAPDGFFIAAWNVA